MPGPSFTMPDRQMTGVIARTAGNESIFSQ